ncbi:MAG: hypothetical protein N3D85_01940 [Candidatus Bathyarchaeota archaeon]|nr:hypothetical protein [Candidatus Bathyarchaeota archaeon]
MPKPVISTEGFNKLIAKAFDESLSALGTPAKEAVYKYLEETFDLKKWEIPYRTEVVEKVIEKIFGAGATPLEQLIKKNLVKKLESTCIVVGLPEYLNTVATYNRLKKENTAKLNERLNSQNYK